MFASLDQPALRALPANAYTYAEWPKRCVCISITTVEFERHYYSVPYQLIKKQLDMRITDHIIECFYKNKRGGHRSSYPVFYEKAVIPRCVSTCPGPINNTATGHRSASSVGQRKSGHPRRGFITRALSSRRCAPATKNYRSCLGILRLDKTLWRKAAGSRCGRALLLGSLVTRASNRSSIARSWMRDRYRNNRNWTYPSDRKRHYPQALPITTDKENILC